MINLYIEYYNDSCKERQNEIDYCLKKNQENELIDNIILFHQNGTTLPCVSKKVIPVETSSRLTYEMFFLWCLDYSVSNNISILSNSDIYFDESISKAYNMTDNECYALLRYDLDQNMNHSIFCLDDGVTPRPDSQDCWIFKKIPSPSAVKDCNFSLGVAGCDNRIAYLINELGYKISNPCSQIKTYHYHVTNKKNYLIENKERISPPYLLINPT